MTTEDFITGLFCRVDDVMQHDHQLPKQPQANLYPSEVVTLGLLYALKGRGRRAFYRWISRDFKALFAQLPSRTRLFRLFAAHLQPTKTGRACFWKHPACWECATATALSWCIRCVKGVVIRRA